MLVQWVVIGVFVLIGLSMLKFEHHTKKIKVTILIIIGFVIYFSMIGIFSSEQVDLTSPRGIVGAVYIYFGWIGETATSLWDIGVDTTHLVGNAIKLDKPEDEKERR